MTVTNPETPAPMTDEERALDRALCNFCNDASDAYEPVAQWNESVRANLGELSAAYNGWYVSLSHRHRSSPSTAAGGLPEEPTNDMATAGARVLGSTMHADNQHARALQVWRQMVKTFQTGTLSEPPK